MYFDGQSFLVSAKDNVRELSQLNGATICAVKRMNHEGHLADSSVRGTGATHEPVIVIHKPEPRRLYFQAECQAFALGTPPVDDHSVESTRRDPGSASILPDQISKEPHESRRAAR